MFYANIVLIHYHLVFYAWFSFPNIGYFTSIHLCPRNHLLIIVELSLSFYCFSRIYMQNKTCRWCHKIIIYENYFTSSGKQVDQSSVFLKPAFYVICNLSCKYVLNYSSTKGTIHYTNTTVCLIFLLFSFRSSNNFLYYSFIPFYSCGSTKLFLSYCFIF